MKINVHFTTYILFTLALLSGFFDILFMIFISIIFHELCHIVVSKLFGRNLKKITVLPFGTIFETDGTDNVNLLQEFLIVIAGPLGSLFLIQFDSLAYINKIILIFNMLPIYPLDGSKLVEVLLCKFFSFKNVLKINYSLSILLSIVISVVGAYTASFNIILIGIALLIINIKSINDYEIRYFNFLVDKVNNKVELPLKIHNNLEVKKLYRGKNNLFMYDNTAFNEVNLIKKVYGM